MISNPARQVKPPVAVMIRVLDDHALVPSSTGNGCYHVAIEDGLAIHCTCPDHARRSRACKHMTAVDAALRGDAPRARSNDTYHVNLVAKTRGGARAAAEAELGRMILEDAARQSAAANRAAALTNAALEAEADDEARDEATESDWDASYGDPCYW